MPDTKPRVLLASYYDRQVIAACVKALADLSDVTDANRGRCLTPDELREYLPSADVSIAADEKYTPEILDRAPDLFLIARDGTGFDGVNVQAASERGILVTRAPVVHYATANLAIGLIIAVVRKLTLCDRGIRENRWVDRRRWLCPDLTGMCLGLFGFGQVGREVAKRALALGMNVIAYDIANVSGAAREMGVRIATIDETLCQADVIAVHMNATPENARLFDERMFARMKAGAYFVNCARGSIVDESALLGALQSGHLAGAALDVFEPEPTSAQNPLFELENVVCTPHVAGDTTSTMVQAIEANLAQIRDCLAGQRPQHLLNPEIWEHARVHRFGRD